MLTYIYILPNLNAIHLFIANLLKGKVKHKSICLSIFLILYYFKIVHLILW